MQCILIVVMLNLVQHLHIDMIEPLNQVKSDGIK